MRRAAGVRALAVQGWFGGGGGSVAVVAAAACPYLYPSPASLDAMAACIWVPRLQLHTLVARQLQNPRSSAHVPAEYGSPFHHRALACTQNAEVCLSFVPAHAVLPFPLPCALHPDA